MINSFFEQLNGMSEFDNAVDGIVTLATTCDATGMFWTYMGVNIMTAVCGAAR